MSENPSPRGHRLDPPDRVLGWDKSLRSQRGQQHHLPGDSAAHADPSQAEFTDSEWHTRVGSQRFRMDRLPNKARDPLPPRSRIPPTMPPARMVLHPTHRGPSPHRRGPTLPEVSPGSLRSRPQGLGPRRSGRRCWTTFRQPQRGFVRAGSPHDMCSRASDALEPRSRILSM